jgi:uncharacterized protein YndB with AHSA1/START domain
MTTKENIVSETVTASATRVVDASCDKVWRAQTDPQYFPQWFGAKPGSVTADLRSGGSWSAIVSPGGQDTKLKGKYLQVIEHRKLVMTIPNGPEYAEVTIVFTDLGHRTEITSSTPVPSEAKHIVEQTAASILEAVAAIAISEPQFGARGPGSQRIAGAKSGRVPVVVWLRSISNSPLPSTSSAACRQRLSPAVWLDVGLAAADVSAQPRAM